MLLAQYSHNHNPISHGVLTLQPKLFAHVDSALSTTPCCGHYHYMEGDEGRVIFILLITEKEQSPYLMYRAQQRLSLNV